jgi:hypothetical protein
MHRLRTGTAANPERSLLARGPPTPALHDHPDENTDGLPKPRGSSPIDRGAEELVQDGHGLQFPHDAGQSRAVMVDLGVLHPVLALGIVEELEHLVEGGARIVDDVGERLSVTIREELLSRRPGRRWFRP